MLMIRTIVRPEKVHDVMQGLLDAGYPAVTKIRLLAEASSAVCASAMWSMTNCRKEMLFLVVPDADKDFVIRAIMDNAKTGDGKFGDGKIFVSAVEEVYTISSGMKESETLLEAKEA